VGLTAILADQRSHGISAAPDQRHLGLQAALRLILEKLTDCFVLPVRDQPQRSWLQGGLRVLISSLQQPHTSATVKIASGQARADFDGL